MLSSAEPAGFGHRRGPGSEARERKAVTFKSLSTSLIARGILALAVGIIALAWPSVTVLALLFGLFNLIAGSWMLVHGIELRRTGKTLQPAREKGTA